MRYSEFKFQALLIATALLWMGGMALVPYFSSQLVSGGASALGFNPFTITSVAYIILTLGVTLVFLLEFMARRAILGMRRAVAEALKAAYGSTSMRTLNDEMVSLDYAGQKGSYLVVLSDSTDRSAEFILERRRFDGKAASIWLSYFFVMRLVRAINVAIGGLDAKKVAGKYQEAVANALARAADKESDDTPESHETPGVTVSQFR